jgi:hypothetical protein
MMKQDTCLVEACASTPAGQAGTNFNAAELIQ